MPAAGEISTVWLGIGDEKMSAFSEAEGMVSVVFGSLEHPAANMLIIDTIAHRFCTTVIALTP